MTRDAEHTLSPQSVVVPVEPTPEMIEAAKAAASFYVQTYEDGQTPVEPVSAITYRAMLAAAPAPSSLAGGEALDRFERAAFAKLQNLPRGAAARAEEIARRDAEYDAARNSILAALSPEAPARDVEEDETYEIGKRDGYEQAVQDIDLLTGGDGEFFVSTAGDDCPDVTTMKARISDRFAALTPRHEAPAELLSNPQELEAPAEGAGEALAAAERVVAAAFFYEDNELFEDSQTVLKALRARSSAPEARSTVSVLAEALHDRMFGVSSLKDPALALAEISDGGGLHEAAHELLRALPPRGSAPEAREGEALDRKADGLAHLVAAISLLKRAEEIGKKPSMATGSKKMFDQMVKDYEGAADRMRKAIYTHPAAPSADKLRVAVEALEAINAHRIGRDPPNVWTGSDICRGIATKALATLKEEVA